MSTVSAIIPTYNRAGLLKEAIESVLAQTYQDWELIVVDDGSMDETPKVLSAMMKADRRVHAVKQQNAGVSEARNTGIRMSSGEFIAFLDDDDLWLPEKLAKQVALMRCHPPEVALTYTRLMLRGSQRSDHRLFPVCCGTSFKELFDTNFVQTSTAMVRRRCLEAVGLFDPRFRIAQDFDLWLRIARRYPTIAYVDEPLVIYRKGQAGLSRRLVDMYLDHVAVLKAVEPDHGLGVTRADQRRQIAQYHYMVARELVNEERFTRAAWQFLCAVRYAPGVGMSMAWPGQQGISLALRWVQPYVAIPYCALRGLLYANR